MEKKITAVDDKAKKFFLEAERYFLDHQKTLIPVAAAVGVLLLLFLCCCCYCCCCRKNKKKKLKEKVKLRATKPSKFLNRIQPGRRVKQLVEDVGSMTFCLKYDHSTQILSVKIIESNDIPVHDLSGHSYSFVEVKLLPLHSDAKVTYQTELVRPASFHPSYGDTFNFCIPASEAKKQLLYLYQYEKNRFSQQDGVGQLVFELKSALTSDETEYVKKLYPFNPLLGLEKETGAVLLSMEFDREQWQLRVNIEEADILPEDEEKEKAVSYVTLVLLNKEGTAIEKRKSPERAGTLQPDFDEQVMFSVPDTILQDVQLLVKLKGKRFLRPNKLIGKTVIKPDSEYWAKLMEDGVLKAHWFQVYKKSNT